MSLESPFSEIAVSANKSRYVVVTVGSILFVCAGIAIVAYPLRYEGHGGVASWLVAALTVGFFGLCAAFAAFKIFDRRPAIVLTPDKLINNSAALQIREILWSEVAYAELVSSMNQRFLVIHLKDPESVLARQSDVVRKTQGTNMALFGSPVLIAGSVLTVSLENLLVMVNERIRSSG